MIELWSLAPAFAAGLAIGAIFFGGLWWTVSRGLNAAQPAVWFLGGLLLRMGLALGGFYLVGGPSWQRWLACLLGFMFARLAVRRMTPGLQAPLAREPGHAS